VLAESDRTEGGRAAQKVRGRDRRARLGIL
jgi:hypothetical protein